MGSAKAVVEDPFPRLADLDAGGETQGAQVFDDHTMERADAAGVALTTGERQLQPGEAMLLPEIGALAGEAVAVHAGQDRMPVRQIWTYGAA